MIYLQVLANGLVLGGLYAAIAVGFSLVWGVLNVINLLHGSFIILGAYVAFFAHAFYGVHPFLSAPLAGLLLFAIGYSLQGAVINRVIRAPVSRFDPVIRYFMASSSIPRAARLPRPGTMIGGAEPIGRRRIVARERGRSFIGPTSCAPAKAIDHVAKECGKAGRRI